MAESASKERNEQSPGAVASATPTLRNSRECEAASKWTFLTNHSHVMVLLNSEPDLVLREVALRVGITERAVQRIIQDLESGGFIVRQRVGRRNHYQVMNSASLRHPIESDRTIGDLLDLFTRS